MLAVGDGRAEDAVRPAPDQLSGPRVQRVRPSVATPGRPGGVAAAARAGGEVNEAVDHARRAVDGGGGLEAPESVPRPRVEGHELSVVRTDVHPLPPDGGGGVDVAARALRPQKSSARGAEGVERPVGVPDEDPAVGDRRRGIEVLPAAEAGQGPGPPAQPAGPCVERVDAAAVRSEIDHAVREGRGAVDLVVGRERPPRLAGVDVDGVELVVPRARVERLTDDEWRRLEDAGSVPPDDLSRPRRHCDDHSGLVARKAVAGQRLHPRVVDDPVRDGRRRRRAVVEPALPDDLPRAVVERVEPASLLRDVQPAVRNGGRKLEDVARLECPAKAERRAQLEVGRGVRPLDAEPIRRPREAKDDTARARRLRRLLCLRRDELDRR